MLFHKFYSIVYTVCEFGERLAIWKIDNRNAKQQVRPVYTWNSLKYFDEKYCRIMEIIEPINRKQ